MNYQRACRIIGKGDEKKGKELIFELAENLERIVDANGKYKKDDYIVTCKMVYDKMILKKKKEYDQWI